jgi:isopenicillin N synthase-like dioxygenase
MTMTPNANIPIIDISADGVDEGEVARQLVDAAADHGFIYIKNIGKDIPIDVGESAFEIVRHGLNHH